MSYFASKLVPNIVKIRNLNWSKNNVKLSALSATSELILDSILSKFAF